MSAFLARQTGPDDCHDVGLCEDRLQCHGANAVQDDDGRGVRAGDSLYERISIVPGIEIVAVTFMAFDCYVPCGVLV
jgi:hypothetical protein